MSFIVENAGQENETYTPEKKTYDMCHIDGDTILYRAAATMQENFIIVTHKETGWTKEFKNVTEFYGRSKSRDGGWIYKLNKSKEAKGEEKVTGYDFDIEQGARVIEPPVGMTVMEYGMQKVDIDIGSIKKHMDADDYRFYFGGGRNFRYDIAKIQDYKGTRTDKPLLLYELREAFALKYKSKVVIVESEIETDDVISIKGWESYLHFKKTGKYNDVIAYIDKDLDQVCCPRFNYNKPSEGIYIPTLFECAKSFVSQMLTGDIADTILGLPNISKEFAKKVGATQKGIGAATADIILRDCDTIPCLYKRVTEAYRSYYGEDLFDFTDKEGNVSQRYWIDMLNENARLLYMLRKYGEQGEYDIRNTLDKMGIEYPKHDIEEAA